MKLRAVLMFLCASLLVFVGIWILYEKAVPSAKPNAILISIDTLRWDHSSVYGYHHDTTPMLRAFAERGVIFESAYAPTSSTCPSHATMFTSLHPIQHGILQNNGTGLNSKHKTLAQSFRASGYQTAAIVSSFVLHSKFGFSNGFDYYNDELDIEDASTKGRKKYLGHKVPGGFDQVASATTRKTIEWLTDRREGESPFFLFVHYMDPHGPYRPPEPYASLFPSEIIEEHAKEIAIQGGIGDYDGEIAYVDASIKKIHEELKRMKLDKSTLIVVVGDHGEGLWQHDGWRDHGKHLYDEAVRVPLVFYWPGKVLKGQNFSEPVDLLTLAPTMLELMGLEHEGTSFMGKSLRDAVCNGVAPEATSPIYMQSRDRGKKKSGIRVGDWKYIEDFEGKQKELYDLKNDPKEMVNLHGKLSKKSELYAAQLRKWTREYAVENASSPTLSEEDKRKLRSLGYLQ